MCVLRFSGGYTCHLRQKSPEIMNKNIKMTACLYLLLAIFSCSSDSEKKEKDTPADPPVVKPLFETDAEYLDDIQKRSLDYMWAGANSNSGLARERIHLDNPTYSENVITTGGSGFGIAGLLVGVERKFLDRKAVADRMERIVNFLTDADRFHGVWPHWIDGNNGRVLPFSTKDDGGDLVESSFLMASLLCVRQYYENGTTQEKAIAEKIDKLWREMEFDWYRNGQDVLYWHWSPNYNWDMNMPITGYNECLITYILAASSPTHSVPSDCYHKGWARGGNITTSAQAQGYPLLLKHNGAEQTGGPLFWAHYSYIGLDPRKLKDKYADYWTVVRNHALSNYAYCVNNPKHYAGYGKDCWGLTASYSPEGYSAHAPGNDLGVIAPTAALSSFPYTPEQSLAALKYFYKKKDWILGKYGFYDAFSEQTRWMQPRYLAIDQCTIAPMIENYRSGFLWKLFMSCPEIQKGLKTLGFVYE